MCKSFLFSWFELSPISDVRVLIWVGMGETGATTLQNFQILCMHPSGFHQLITDKKHSHEYESKDRGSKQQGGGGIFVGEGYDYGERRAQIHP